MQSEREQIGKIDVLIVDDSALVRQVMRTILSADRNIEVETAADPVIAFTKIEKHRPDVVITDLEMPRLNGLSFLRKIMDTDRPVPVIVCSGSAEKGSERAMSALALGAVDVIAKPKIGVRDFLHESAVLLLDSVWAAAKAKVSRRCAVKVEKANSADVMLPPFKEGKAGGVSEGIIAVGASTGGTEALEVFLSALPAECPGVVIVQHMPEVFTRAFAERLNRTCAIEVKEAIDDAVIVRGQALIAPGNRHLLVQRSNSHYLARVKDGPLVSRHRPSVDVLFRSVAQAAGPNGIGIIMTGMGADGAQGLLEMRTAGALTIAQDEATCVVFGMPREAIALGAPMEVLPLHQLARAAMRMYDFSTSSPMTHVECLNFESKN